MGDVPGPSTAPYFMPRKATENFARLCQLIMTICSDLLRDVLSRYIKPADLRSELDNNRRKLEKIMNAAQKDLIYPASGSSAITAKDLDISVLYILLRNICNIPKHKNGWGKPPKKGDKSIAACIEKIKNERNLISGHSTAGAIEDNEFQNHWTELRDAIVEIEKCLTSGNLYERGVELLLSCDLNPQKSKEYEDEFKRIQERIESLESSKARTEKKIEDIQSFQRKTENELVIKQAKMNNLEKNVKKSSGRKRKDQGYSKRKKFEDLEKRIKGLEGDCFFNCCDTQCFRTIKHVLSSWSIIDPIQLAEQSNGKFFSPVSTDSRLDKVEDQQNSVTQEIRERFEEFETSILSIMQGRLSALNNTIEGRLIGMEQKIEGTLSRMGEKMEGNPPNLETLPYVHHALSVTIANSHANA
uniref:DZIP3-like HEPN domain-containing protein n=1 Tax=Magallana gigas TaxID=29159 RepID=K1QF88_MAGGI